MLAHARRRIAGVSPDPGLGIADIGADGPCGPAMNLPGQAQLDRSAALVIDESVLARLQLGLELDGQSICDPVFGMNRQGVVASEHRQSLLDPGGIEGGPRLHALIFEDRLPLPRRDDPGAGLSLRSRDRGDAAGGQSQAS